MIFSKRLSSFLMTVIAVFALLGLLSCGSNFNGNLPEKELTPSTPLHFSGTSYASVGSYTSNTMTVTVNGSNCESGGAYYNEPCVSVTLCGITTPTNCQTIDNILLDTGSFGLRLFKSVISSSVLSDLPAVTNGDSALGTCAVFGDATSLWGSVNYAYVQLGGEPKVAVPIQIVDSSFNNPPPLCTSRYTKPNTSPSDAGFNGILGVGIFAQDCGSDCTTTSTNYAYYTCTDEDCEGGATVDLTAQVTNPVSALPTDNNGVVVDFPSVGSTGVSSLNGTITLGIGTEGAISTSPTTFMLSSDYNFITNSGTSYDSDPNDQFEGFLDTGSNFFYFPSATLTACTSPYGDFYCPTSLQSLTYTNTSATNTTVNSTVTFSIDNFLTLINANPTSAVFGNLGGTSGSLLGGTFDWGLPFFFGRTVYVGIEGTTSTLGTGPYYAY
jgi:hypothetical protein